MAIEESQDQLRHVKADGRSKSLHLPEGCDRLWVMRPATEDELKSHARCKVCLGRLERQSQPPKAKKPAKAKVDSTVTVRQTEPQPKQDPVKAGKARVKAGLAAAKNSI